MIRRIVLGTLTVTAVLVVLSLVPIGVFFWMTTGSPFWLLLSAFGICILAAGG